MRVAIVGGPGIGKSTLIRQLGDLYHNGTYGEGEEGVWATRMLEDIAAGRNAVGVTEYFARIYDANYRDAAEHDRPGSRHLFRRRPHHARGAHGRVSRRRSSGAAARCCRSATGGIPERIIVLTSSVDTIEKHIKLRNRPHEAAENMVRRFRLIDAEFRRLAPSYPNTVVINRDGMEFHTRRGLTDIIAAAGLPMFREIPYASR